MKEKSVGNYTNVLPELTTIPVATFEDGDAETVQECVITSSKGTFALLPVPGEQGQFYQRWQRFSHSSNKPCKVWDDVLDDSGVPSMFVIEQEEIVTGRLLTIRTGSFTTTYRVYDAMLRDPAPRDKNKR